MINECLSGQGQPKATAPARIPIESGVVCAALGVQGGSCAFVDAIFFILQPCIDDFLGAFLDLLSGKNTRDKFSFKIAEKVFETIELIADGATLLAAIDPNNGIPAVDFCKAKPQFLPDETALKLGIVAALLCQPDQLIRQIADIWHYDNWFKYCECKPVPEPTRPPFYQPRPNKPPRCGDVNQSDVDRLNFRLEQLFSESLSNTNLINQIVAQNNANGDPVQAFTFPSADRRQQGGTESPITDTTNIRDRIFVIRYASPFGGCECREFFSVVWQTYGYALNPPDVVTDLEGRLPVNPFLVWDGIQILSGGPCGPLANKLTCADLPELCPCKEIIAEPAIPVDCEEKEIIQVTYLNDKCPTFDLQVTSPTDCDEKAIVTINYPYYDPGQSL